MTLTWPWSLVGLAVVAAAALWALLRPGRRLVNVGSLSLWKEAVEAVDRSKRRRSRKAGLSWLCLLVGALTGVMAMTRPVYRSSSRIRSVALAIYPSAELAGAGGGQELRAAAGQLLGRLSADDRVQVLLPLPLAGSEGPVGRDRARQIITEALPLPVPARDMDVPDPVGQVQRVYHLAPAGAIEPAGASATVIQLAPRMPAVTVAALGAVDAPGGTTQVFVALRNHTGSRWQGDVVCKICLDGKGELVEPAGAAQRKVSVPPNAVKRVVLKCPRAAAVGIELRSPASTGSLGTRGYLVRRERVVSKVAMVGADEPLVRRFVRRDRMLELVARADEADLVVVNRAKAPGGRPALIIKPPSAPPGWRAGKEIRAVELAHADVDNSDPVMRYVDLSAVAVRRLVPWVASDRPTGKRLVSYKGDAIILRTTPAAADTADKTRKIFVSFDLSSQNTNLVTAASDPFVILMANAMRWLAPAGRGKAVYEFVRPERAGPRGDWKRLTADAPPWDSPLLWPGLYSDSKSSLAAVSIVGLRGGRSDMKSPRQAVADAPLPEPKFLGRDKELWALLGIIAMAFWLVGWVLRFL